MQPPPATVDPLHLLGNAESVELGPVGVAATRTPGYAAFEALAADPAALARLRPSLNGLLESARPAARLYAAMLLHRLDPAEGERALRSLMASTERVGVWPGGCSPLPVTTLGEAARALLERATPQAPTPTRPLEYVAMVVWVAFPVALIIMMARACL